MKKTLWMVLGSVGVVLGGFLVFLYLQSMRDMAIAGALGAIIFLAGGFVIFKSLTGGFSPSFSGVSDKKKIAGQKYNSMVGEADQLANGKHVARKLKLEHIDKPEQYGGIQINIENNKQAYYVFTRVTIPPVNGEGVKKVLAPYLLRDTQYYSPRTVAKYWGLAGIKDAFSLHEDPMKLIGPGMIVVGMIVAFIALVAT